MTVVIHPFFDLNQRFIHSRDTAKRSIISGIGSTPIPGPVGTLMCPSTKTNGSVRSVSK